MFNELLLGSAAGRGGKFKEWMKQNKTFVKDIVPIFIGIVGLIALIFVLSKAIWAFKNGKANDALKHFLYGAGIVIIVVAGIVGLKTAVDNILGGDNGIIDYDKGTGNDSTFTADASDVQLKSGDSVKLPA